MDISKEAVERLDSILRNWDRPQSPFPVFDNGVPLVRLSADTLRDLSSENERLQAQVDELEIKLSAQINHSNKLLDANESSWKRGRLRGLNEAIEAIGEMDIPIGQTVTVRRAQATIEALKGDGND